MTPARLGFPYEDPDARLASACTAFLAAKLARCAAACRTVARSADAPLRAEATLLWARALIRLGRNGEAVTALDALDALDAAGEPLGTVAAMLRGTARMRLGEADGVRALERLIANGLDTPGAVEAVLEIARIDLAENDHVTAGARLAAVPVPFGPIGARVLEHRGFVAFVGSRYDEALEAWRASLDMFGACGVFDQLIAANIAFATCIIAIERIDPALWERAQRLVARCAFLRRGPTLTAHQLHYVASLWHDLYGRPMDALVSARNAEAFAPTPLERVTARCARAAIFFHYGEPLACAETCSTIRADFAALEIPGAVCGVEEGSVSEIAETLATIGDADGAVAAMGHRGDGAFTDSITLAADRHVQSLVADAVGETLKARHMLEQAFWEWQRLGNRRRALLAALRLLEIGPHRDASAYADDVTRALPPESWARAAYVRLTRNLPASQSVSLNRAQRDVLDMLVRGMSTAEIARVRRRSEGTTRNTISSLLRAFGVPTRQALLSEYMKRTSLPAEPADGGRVRLFS